jgi:hypothetical protein
MGYLGRTPTPSPIDASDIPANSIDASKIIDGAIAVADVADNAITEAKIADAAVVSLKSGRKNLIINGGFDVWQRGTSASSSQLSYLADRWYNATSETQSRQTFTVGQTDVPHNPTYYHRGSSGSTEWYGLKQKVENVAITAGREVTLSYWAKGSSAFTNAPYRGQNFGSGGSSEVNAALSTASITTSWARYTHTFTLPSISGKTVGAGNYMQINIMRANVNNITIDLANCQLEFGSVATDFEHRSYGEELALCQRYYTVVPYYSESSVVNSVFGHAKTNNRYTWTVTQFPVTMRTAPTMGFISGALGSGSTTADGKIRYAETFGGSGGSDLVPYGNTIHEDSFCIKTYNEHNATTWYGIQAGYTADAEL